MRTSLRRPGTKPGLQGARPGLLGALPGLLGALALPGLLGACEADLPDYPRGDPSQEIYSLTSEHPGWQEARCDTCHAEAHRGMLGAEECSICHGPNGAPALGASHPGWGTATCDGCHDAVPGHPTGLTPSGCVGCHGANGSSASPPVLTPPQVTEAHAGWQRADCGACHSASGTHGGSYAATTCGACHGTNGAPLRPANHWLVGCNDCHADGPYPWNDCTHQGFEPLAPETCRYCHR